MDCPGQAWSHEERACRANASGLEPKESPLAVPFAAANSTEKQYHLISQESRTWLRSLHQGSIAWGQ